MNAKKQLPNTQKVTVRIIPARWKTLLLHAWKLGGLKVAKYGLSGLETRNKRKGGSKQVNLRRFAWKNSYLIHEKRQYVEFEHDETLLLLDSREVKHWKYGLTGLQNIKEKQGWWRPGKLARIRAKKVPNTRRVTTHIIPAGWKTSFTTRLGTRKLGEIWPIRSQTGKEKQRLKPRGKLAWIRAEKEAT